MPIDFPLWYVRDLIVIVLCSPLLYRMIKAGVVFVVLLGFLWLGFNIELCGIEATGFFFFALGGYFAVHGIKLVSAVDPNLNKILIVLLFIVLIILDMITRGETYHYLCHNATILVGMVFIFMCIVTALKAGKTMNLIVVLTPSTFFIYALHGLFVATLRKGLYVLLQPVTNIAVVGTYALSIILTVMLSLLCYYALSKISPKFCSLLNGGR